MTVLTAVERSLLRTLAFIFYQLDRNRAKYCASSILQWYFQLQTQLPVAAVDSLERVAASVVALSDAKFTTFWLSLLEKEMDLSDDDDDDDTVPHMHASDCMEARIDIRSYESDTRTKDDEDTQQQREKTLVKRLYQHIYYRIQSFFWNTTKCAASPSDRGPTQTPCTSPIDLSDESHYQPHRRRRYPMPYLHDEDDEERGVYYDDDAENSSRESDQEGDAHTEDEDHFEPGWAVEYMEQESMVSNEMTRRMRKMMHSSIPLNLFRVTVAYDSEQAEEAGEGGFVGVISPESFPPTPITRDLQTRQMNRYTVAVLDHATLALRLLEANCAT